MMKDRMTVTVSSVLRSSLWAPGVLPIVWKSVVFSIKGIFGAMALIAAVGERSIVSVDLLDDKEVDVAMRWETRPPRWRDTDYQARLRVGEDVPRR